MAEAGHAANRVFIDQNGKFNLNGGGFVADNDTDISTSINTAVGSGDAGQNRKVVGGSSANSSLGINSFVTGLSQILGASANVNSTVTPTTAAGIPFTCQVGFSTASGTLKVVAFKPTSTANVQAQIATSTAFSIAWTAFGI